MARNHGTPQSYSVTSAGVNPAEDRAHRMRMYFTAMVLRVVCVSSLFWVRGWWVVVPVLGAIFLPWFAVMVGNAVAHGGEQKLQALDPLQLAGTDGSEQGPADNGSETLLVFDVDPVRRKSDIEDTDAGPPDAPSPPEHPDANEESA